MSTEAAPGGKKKKMIIIAAIAIVALAIIGVAMFFIFHKQEEQRQVINGVETTTHSGETPEVTPEAAAAAALAAAPQFTDTEMFTSNLGDAQGMFFIQIGIIFEVHDKAAIDPILKPVMPIVRSQTLLLLGTKTSTELRTIDGKRLLADQILEIARRAVGVSHRDKIVAVHFTNFVIQ